MGEIRKDYVLDRYVIINADRGKRPLQFLQEPTTSNAEHCPFCPSNSALLPPIITRLPFGDDENGIIVVPNKFAIVKHEGDAKIRTHNKYYTFGNSYGEHVVVIEGSRHGIPFAELSQDQVVSVLLAYQDVYRRLYGRGALYVSLFKNEGGDAGASIDHPHSQAVSLPVLPESMLSRYEAFLRFQTRQRACPYCEVSEREATSDRRVLMSDDWTVFCPYASPNPFDTVFFPRRHVARFIDLTREELVSLAEALLHVLKKLSALHAPYNMEIIDGNGSTDYHAHIVVSPRLKVEAGFELETGIIVNPLPPEQAAEHLR